MSDKKLQKKAYHFHGMSVLVPEREAGEVIPFTRGSFLPPNFKPSTSHFNLIRIIENLSFVKKADHDRCKVDHEVFKLAPLTTFDPPILLYVYYYPTDTAKCGNDYTHLQLAYWDCDNSDWVVISDAEHDFQIFPPAPDGTGFATLTISSWPGDPGVGWGDGSHPH